MTSRFVLALGALLTSAGLAAPAAAAPVTATDTPAPAAAAAAAGGGVAVTDGCLDSVPEPGSTEPVAICYTVFRPAGADRTHRVPMVVHSHGWGGSRTTDPAAFARWLDAGYGVLSFDQRGFGESGGKAHVENPAYEGHDVRALVALISRLPWVQQDGPVDPVMGAIGGSYGGGYQFLAAFESLRTRGSPVLDALAPEITWYDLRQSLAPQGVVRTAWALALSAAALPSQALPESVYKGLVEGAATGTLPDGSVPGTEDLAAFFRKNGPKWHVDHGRRLDIPVLLGQGTTDSLFPLQQGLANWQHALTPAARRHSIFVAYNGGHVLPAVLPQGVDVTSDPCSEELAGGDFTDLAIRFFDEQLRGRDTGLRGYGAYHLATPASTCTTVGSVRADTAVDIGTVATTEAAGAPVPYAVAVGPIRVAGTPYLTGTLTALGVENRAFYGLAVGTSPADARLVQDNVLPLRAVQPVTGERRRVALPSVAVDVPAGQTLYLLASPVSDTFVGMASRTPGAVVLDDTVVHLPVVGRP
jgi:pimeloyl-ACP methyl ester carboxylesterase